MNNDDLKIKCLVYDCLSAPVGEDYQHPQDVMREFGIEYKHCVPQSLYDSWWFFGCSNIPDSLPSMLKIREIDPMKAVGFGLSVEKAQEIISWGAGDD